MKRFVFEADKDLHEKPSEPKHVFNSTAKAVVIAEDVVAATEMAKAKLRQEFLGTGILLKNVRLAREDELPVDWSYGYDDGRLTGDVKDKIGSAQIR